MPNTYFRFKQFTVHQERCAMKVTTDACLFGAWVAGRVESLEFGVEGEHADGLREPFVNVLDIGTGSGLLPLMVAQKNKVAVDAIEIDEGAYQQAKENVTASPWKEMVNIIQGDARTYPFSKKYDIIISNPPFYEKEIRSADDKRNIAHHGQSLQLHELFTVVHSNLSASGRFFLLLPFKRNNGIDRAALQDSLYIEEKVLVRQTEKHPYFRIMISGSFTHKEMTMGEMAICLESQQYTKEFVHLLKDYYLYL